MSVSGASRFQPYASSEDDSIIVSTASSISDDSDDQNVHSTSESSQAMQMTTDKTTSNGTAVTRTTAVPVMATREHVLHDCPSDVRRYFLVTHIADEQATPEEQAINLRKYAQISKAHQEEAIAMFNELPDVGMAATRNALPTMATFEKKAKGRKNQFDLASQELFRTYRHVYADVSTSTLLNATQTVRFPKGTRQIAINNLTTSDHVKEFIIDVSHDAFYFPVYDIPRHINLWTGEVNIHEAQGLKKKQKIITQWNAELNERTHLSETLCDALRNFSARKDASAIAFGLKCTNQPFKTFLFPVAQTLAECKAGLGSMKSLDLSYSFQAFEHNYSWGNQHHASDLKMLATYADNLVEFLSSNKSLEYLNLCRNDLRPASLMRIMEALKENVTLKSLDLSINNFSRDWIESESVIHVLVGSLEGKKSLSFVNLAGCGLSNSAADLLVEFLKKNPQVTVCIAVNQAISDSHVIYKLDNVEADHSDLDDSSS